MRKYKQKNLRNKIYQEKWQYEEQLLTAKIVTIQGRDYKDLVTIWDCQLNDKYESQSGVQCSVDRQISLYTLVFNIVVKQCALYHMIAPMSSSYSTVLRGHCIIRKFSLIKYNMVMQYMEYPYFHIHILTE